MLHVYVLQINEFYNDAHFKWIPVQAGTAKRPNNVHRLSESYLQNGSRKQILCTTNYRSYSVSIKLPLCFQLNTDSSTNAITSILSHRHKMLAPITHHSYENCPPGPRPPHVTTTHSTPNEPLHVWRHNKCFTAGHHVTFTNRGAVKTARHSIYKWNRKFSHLLADAWGSAPLSKPTAGLIANYVRLGLPSRKEKRLQCRQPVKWITILFSSSTTSSGHTGLFPSGLCL
jgi:hypothetical protein